MTLRVEWVPYGRAGADRLRAAIGDAKAGEPLAPVTVVVPSNHVGVATRRLLAGGTLGPVCGRGQGLAAVGFLTPYRLAELLGAPLLAATGRRPVSTPVIAAALRAALAEAPGVFGPVAAHPATETALVAAYRDLRGGSDGALAAVAATGARAADVVRIHRSARARLEADWYDEEDLLGAAVTALASGADRLGLGAVVAYLPQRLSRHVIELLAATAGACGLSVLAGVTGEERADAEVTAGVVALTERCRTTGAAGAPAPPPPEDPPFPLVGPDRSRVVTASDADDEVRGALRAVLDATREGTPLDRIAILYAAVEPYARLVHDHLAAAGVPANGAAVTPVAAGVAGRTLLGLLALPEGGFRRGDVFAWLSGAPLRHESGPVPAAAWERLSRDAAVVAGVEHWDRLVAHLASERGLAADAHDADPDAPPWRAERAREDAARAGDLRCFVLGLAGELETAARGPRSWGEHASWAGALLDRLLGGPDRRAGWPADERWAAGRVEVAVARLAALDRTFDPVDLATFARTLALELESDLGRRGRFGEGVLVGSVGMGVGLDLDLVVVLGLAEGTFPSRPGDDSLLPDHERRAAGGELALRREAPDRQHRQLLAALAGARTHRLGIPRGDLRASAARVPSRFVLRLAGGMPVEHVASFDAGLRAAVPATGQEHRLRALLADGGMGPATDALLARDPVLAGGAAVLAARRGERFTRFDGHVGGTSGPGAPGLDVGVPSPVAGVTSTSRLERWAGCPHDYFLQHVLGVAPVENPEEALEITAVDKGNLVHAALETFITEVLDRPPADQPAPDQPWPDTDRARLAEIAGAEWDRYQAAGRTGRPIFWRRDRTRILVDLTRFLSGDDENRARHGTRPMAAELGFGWADGSADPVGLTLPDGRVVRFRGKADRVDVAEDGSLHVVDYKTGSAHGYDVLSEEDPVDAGRKLQLAVYGLAARLHGRAPHAPVFAEYWFVSAKGDFKRIGYPVTDQVLAIAAEVIGTIVAGIEAGVFPAHPVAGATTPSAFTCRACDPDGLGVVDLRRAWVRKRSDAALAPYADLAEPLAGVEPEVETLTAAGGSE